MKTATAAAPADDPAPRAPAAVAVRRHELSLKSLVIAGALLAGVWLLLRILPALLILVAALILVCALNPLVHWLERWKVRRFLAIGCVFTVGATLTAALLVLTVPTLITQVKTLAENEPGIRETVAAYLAQFPATATLATEIRNVSYVELVRSSSTTLLTFGARLGEIVAYLVAAVFLAFYMMLDRDRLRGGLFAVVPRRHHIRLSRILLNLATIVGGYIRGQLLTCALMGGFILALLLTCHVPNALSIAVFGGLMDLLPYIGIFLTMGPAVLAAGTQGTAVAVVVFALMLAYEELESRVLVPLVYGRALRLPSSVVFFSLILGTVLGGIVGALLALPIAAAMLMLVAELRVELPGETEQPGDAAQQRADDRTEQEYERRAESNPAVEAAAIAVEISADRRDAEGASNMAQAAADPAKPL